jgi:malate/lactate dehydrogenase
MRVALVGAAGGIGSAVAYSLVLEGLGSEFLLVDVNAAALETQVMDLEQLRGSVRPFSVRSAEMREIPSADVVVISASTPPRADLPRMDYLKQNLAITREISDVFKDESHWPGVVIIASNPVDPLVLDFQRRTGIERKRVLGYSINDTLRFRYAIAIEAGVSPDCVTAWVIGEHGNLCVPLFSRVTVDGNPFRLLADQQQRVREYLLGWYPRWVALGTSRTSTWTSGYGIARMVSAISTGGSGPWPAAFALDGEYGISGVALSLPVVLGARGVESVVGWDLAPEESEALRKAADYLADIDAAELGQ